jgi:hypothetical protein
VEPQLKWKKPHLLEIEYQKATIYSFTSVSYPFREYGNPASGSYRVEVRLAPSSPDL